MMPVSRKGRGQKKVTQRPVPIQAPLAARLRVCAADKASDALLLVKPNGDPWRGSSHSVPFRRVVERAGQDPDEVTIYALRHSSIVRQILANIPIRVVAALH